MGRGVCSKLVIRAGLLAGAYSLHPLSQGPLTKTDELSPVLRKFSRQEPFSLFVCNP